MAMFSITPAKEKALHERMDRLGIREEDLRETFIRSSGPGGQRVNKASTCVFLVHEPTGFAVKCQDSRSQATNRYLARRHLADKVESLQKGRESAEQQKIEKIRRQKRKRSKRAKEKILKLKHEQSEKKAFRSKQSISRDDY